MSFRPNHPAACSPLPTGLGSSWRGGSCRTSLCSNTRGLGTAINNANTGECLLIYGMKSTEVHKSSPRRSWEPDQIDGLPVITQVHWHWFRALDSWKLFHFLDSSDSSQESPSLALWVCTPTLYVLFSYPGSNLLLSQPFLPLKALASLGQAVWKLQEPSSPTHGLCQYILFPPPLPTCPYSGILPPPQLSWVSAAFCPTGDI